MLESEDGNQDKSEVRVVVGLVHHVPLLKRSVQYAKGNMSSEGQPVLPLRSGYNSSKRICQHPSHIRSLDMDNSTIIQLTTLWFVILVFIQTGSGGSGPLLTAIGVLAIFLAYIIPVTILVLLGIRLFGE